jgi:S1-C subfamily serine protease
MPLTIPISTVERVLDALLTRGRVARGYLGVAMQPVRLGKALAERLGLVDKNDDAEGAHGVLVVAVESDSPADRAGLLVGDVLVAVGAQRVGEPQEVAEFLGGETVGKSLAFTVVRGGEKKTVDVTVGERPSAEETGARGGRRRR